jgi:predicted dehydrogenase
MGRVHATKLRSQLVAVVDPSPGSDDLPWADCVPDDIDAVVVATPAAKHFEVALPLLERGVPTLVEKPLAADLEQARSLARFPGLCVNHVERFNPVLAALPGHVHHISAHRMAPFGPRGTDVDVVLDLMIHDLDLVLRLLGPVHEVRAVGLSVESSSIDHAEVWLEAERGVASLVASRVAPGPARVLEVTGDEGRRRLNLTSGEAWQLVAGERPKPLGVHGGDALDALHHAFLSAVALDSPMPVPGAEALAAMELAARVSEAIERRA